MYKRLFNALFTKSEKSEIHSSGNLEKADDVENKVKPTTVSSAEEKLVPRDFQNKSLHAKACQTDLPKSLQEIQYLQDKAKEEKHCLEKILIDKNQALKDKENRIAILEKTINNLESQACSRADYENTLDNLLGILKQNEERLLLMQRIFSVMKRKKGEEIEQLTCKINLLEHDLHQKTKENLQLKTLVNRDKINSDLIVEKNSLKNKCTDYSSVSHIVETKHDTRKAIPGGDKEEVVD